MRNIAIIGAGNIAASHIRGYLAHPEQCRITALTDTVPEKAHARNREFNLGTEVYSSYKDILTGKGIDLVSICTPPFCHAEITIDCLNAGIDVFVEKPMAASLAECDAMLKAQKDSGRTLSVVAQNRFRPDVAALKAVLDSGKAGRVVHAQVDSHWWRGHSYYDLWWRGLWEKEGGGCTLNHAVHHIDMLAWMLGLPRSVCAMLSNAAHDNAEVEDISVAALLYSGAERIAPGALAQITSSVIHHGQEQQLIFQCEKARLSAPWKTAASLSQPNGFPLPNPELEAKLNAFHDTLPAEPFEGHTNQISDLLRALEAGTPPAVTGEDGRRVIELITAIYKAGSEKRTIDLPIAPGDPFYTAEGILQNVPRFYEKTSAMDDLDGQITT